MAFHRVSLNAGRRDAGNTGTDLKSFVQQSPVVMPITHRLLLTSSFNLLFAAMQAPNLAAADALPSAPSTPPASSTVTPSTSNSIGKSATTTGAASPQASFPQISALVLSSKVVQWPSAPDAYFEGKSAHLRIGLLPLVQLNVGFPDPDGWVVLATQRPRVTSAITDAGEDITFRDKHTKVPFPMQMRPNRGNPFVDGGQQADTAMTIISLAAPTKPAARIARLAFSVDLLLARLGNCHRVVVPLIDETEVEVKGLPDIDMTMTLHNNGVCAL